MSLLNTHTDPDIHIYCTPCETPPILLSTSLLKSSTKASLPCPKILAYNLRAPTSATCWIRRAGYRQTRRPTASSSRSPASSLLQRHTMSRVLYQEDLKALTVADLKADPSLVSALRQLQASVNGAGTLQPDVALSAPSTIATKSKFTNIWEITHAAAPPSEMLLRPTSTSQRLRVDANRMRPSGIHTVSAPGPGWMGPCKAMESCCRLKGPAHV